MQTKQVHKNTEEGDRETTSNLKPFPFYYKELPTFQSVSDSLNERDSIEVKRSLDDSWFTVCSKNNIFQIWNKEYIEALSKEILNLVGKDFVLEVAAGDGMLSHWLREYGVNIKATDNMSREPSIQTYSEVEELDAVSAIRKYESRMVVASWIEYDSELDCEILDEEPEYLILIGEGNGGCTGSTKFWGDNWDEDNKIPAYWIKKEYGEKQLEVDTWNLCRTDYGHKWGRHHGSTMLYTKGG